MKTSLEIPACEAETIDFGHDDNGDDWKASGNAPGQAGPEPLWLKARVRTIGFRHADLMRTHWKKVCLSMVED
jgi:hypothetical protein